MNKINVIGISGSGKSTFAKSLSEKLDYPYIEMDEIFWKRNWIHLENEEFCEQLKERLKTQNWILDGKFSRTTKVKWENVDTIIWIDYSISRTLFQAIRRAFKRIIDQEELWENTGNKESFRRLISKDSIVLWTIQTHHEKKRKYSALLNDPLYQHIDFIRLRSPKESKAFLEQINH